MKKDSLFEKNKLFFAIIIGAIIIGIFILTSLLIINNKSNDNSNSQSEKNSQNPIANNNLDILSNPSTSSKDITYETVIKIVDGDTITLSNNEKIRLIGINTEERGQKCYQEATDRLSELILNKKVKLETDIDKTDKYGRSLRFVFLENENINALLVKEGLATVYTVGSNKKYLSELEKAQRDAREGQGCIWQKSPSCKDCIGMAYLNSNAEGDDCKNPNDEYIKFSNSCSAECELTGWTIKDEATHIYTFPEFILQSNSLLTLKSGKGTDTTEVLFWDNNGNSGQCPAIWNNDKDTIYLRDKQGSLVLEHNY
ncbi:MAG: Nuclease (SNase domain protein) [Parcubacteria group bacterium GW2011_GWA1_36_12]|nr:MAG: Nuclease (SNase domain protein) [Parcubacteria group bacterium GW2011_GWA1_36_12]